MYLPDSIFYNFFHLDMIVIFSIFRLWYYSKNADAKNIYIFSCHHLTAVDFPPHAKIDCPAEQPTLPAFFASVFYHALGSIRL